MKEDVIGIIPAAGQGLRLGLPYPKELYPIIKDNHYKPVAQHILENMTAAGVPHVVFVVNETKHQLMGYFGDGHRFNCHLSYVIQEDRGHTEDVSPGLSQALDSAYHLARGKTVAFGMADTIIQPTNVFARMMQAMEPNDDVVLSLFETNDPEKFGMVGLHSLASLFHRPFARLPAKALYRLCRHNEQGHTRWHDLSRACSQERHISRPGDL